MRIDLLSFAIGVLATAATTHARPDTAPPTQSAEARQAFKSYQQLRDYYAERQRRVMDQLLGEQVAALEQFIETARGDDLENAYRDLIAAAMSLGRYGRAIELAGEYRQAFGGAARATMVAALRVQALTELGRLDEAAAEWKNLAGTPLPEDVTSVFDAGLRVGDSYLLAGQVGSARRQYEELRRRMGHVPNVAPILDRREGALSWIGKEAPALAGEDLAGRPVRMDEYRGKVVLLDFWATTAPPAVHQMPELVQTFYGYRRQGFEIIGISLDVDGRALKNFVATAKIPWRQLFDGRASAGPNAVAYGVKAVPTQFLIGRDGKIAFMPISMDDLHYAVPKLLNARAPTPPHGTDR